MSTTRSLGAEAGRDDHLGAQIGVDGDRLHHDAVVRTQRRHLQAGGAEHQRAGGKAQTRALPRGMPMLTCGIIARLEQAGGIVGLEFHQQGRGLVR